MTLASVTGAPPGAASWRAPPGLRSASKGHPPPPGIGTSRALGNELEHGRPAAPLQSRQSGAVAERWRRRTVIAVGGLTEVGLVPNSDLLLVVSHQGRGIVDVQAGAVVGRDPEEAQSGWFDEQELRALAIPPAAGWVAVAGLAGGHLPAVHGTTTLWASGSGVIVRERDGSESLLPESEEVRAYGFLPQGWVVVAAPSSLSIFERT